MMKKSNIHIGSKAAAISVLAAVLGLGGIGFPLAASAIANNNSSSVHTYMASIHELNNTHVSGMARFVQNGRQLSTTVNATGLEPGVHPMHIHGKNQAKAECPTSSNDTNGDGFVSVIEGAPSYGLIKLNLTSPQTAFGKPPTPALFYPFAGTPNNSNFPKVGSDGILHFSATYTFDNSNDAEAALQSLTPLGNQAIVIHGATAPQGVDAPAFAALGNPRPQGYDPTARAYDVLLPAGCGTLKATAASDGNQEQAGDDVATTVATKPTSTDSPQTSTTSTKGDQLQNLLNPDQAKLRMGIVQALQQISPTNVQDENLSSAVTSFTDRSDKILASFNTSSAKAVAVYNTATANNAQRDVARNELINVLASAKDSEINNLYDSRNQLVDQLNRQGLVNSRNAFLNSFDAVVDQFGNSVEQAKNQL